MCVLGHPVQTCLPVKILHGTTSESQHKESVLTDSQVILTSFMHLHPTTMQGALLCSFNRQSCSKHTKQCNFTLHLTSGTKQCRLQFCMQARQTIFTFSTTQNNYNTWERALSSTRTVLNGQGNAMD